MANVFLKVDKELFKLGLNPTEILIYAQVIEFDTNTKDCFMSDKAFAEMLGVSDKTVSRALAHLEEKNLIKRETKNVKGGKERHIKVIKSQNDYCDAQGTKCPLTTDNLSIDNRQNVLIKDNIKDNILKDNIAASAAPEAATIVATYKSKREIAVENSFKF